MIWLLSAVSVFMFVGTLLALPFIVARIPEDYLKREERDSRNGSGRHPVLRFAFLVARNLLGIIFILTGVVLIFMPGQGILMIVVGILLTTFPGKRRLVLRMVKKKKVLAAINWMRGKAHKPPLQPP